MSKVIRLRVKCLATSIGILCVSRFMLLKQFFKNIVPPLEFIKDGFKLFLGCTSNTSYAQNLKAGLFLCDSICYEQSTDHKAT